MGNYNWLTDRKARLEAKANQSGTYASLPIADPTGVTVEQGVSPMDGTTPLNVLTFPTDAPALAIKLAGDAFPRWLMFASASDGVYLGDGTSDPWSGQASLNLHDGKLSLNTTFQAGDSTFSDNVGPVVKDTADGHTYRLITTNGVVSAVQVT